MLLGFVFGTKSELKDQKILEKGDVLKSADLIRIILLRLIFVLIRKSSCILNAPKLLTTHPAGHMNW